MYLDKYFHDIDSTNIYKSMAAPICDILKYRLIFIFVYKHIKDPSLTNSFGITFIFFLCLVSTNLFYQYIYLSAPFIFYATSLFCIFS